MFQHFQGHVNRQLNIIDARLEEIYNLVRQMARTSFTPGGGPGGNSFGGAPPDGGYDHGDGGS